MSNLALYSKEELSKMLDEIDKSGKDYITFGGVESGGVLLGATTYSRMDVVRAWVRADFIQEVKNHGTRTTS